MKKRGAACRAASPNINVQKSEN